MVTKAIYLFLKDNQNDIPDSLSQLYELFDKSPHITIEEHANQEALKSNQNEELVDFLRKNYQKEGMMNVSTLLSEGLWTLSREGNDSSGMIIPYDLHLD